MSMSEILSETCAVAPILNRVSVLEQVRSGYAESCRSKYKLESVVEHAQAL